MHFAAPRTTLSHIFAAPTAAVMGAAIFAAILLAPLSLAAQEAPPPATSEYDNVPPGLLLTPAQRIDHAANVVPAAPVKNNETAGLVAPDEMAAPTVDPQMPMHSLSVLEQKPVATDDTPTIIAMPQIEQAYAKGEYQSIIRPLEMLVMQKDAHAALLLGIMMEEGKGVAANPQRAAELYARAADAGMPQAQHRLALQYYQGKGVAKDSLQAMMWLHIASSTYKDGPQKQRAIADRNNLQATLSRRDRETAMFMAREWMTRKGILHLLEEETEKPITAPSAPAPAAAPTVAPTPAAPTPATPAPAAPAPTAP